MTDRPPHALPSVSPQEMDFLISRTGMTLNSGQRADLVLAWRQLSAMAATIPRRTVLADDFAFAFRLPSTESNSRSKPASRTTTKPKPVADSKADRSKSGKAKP